MSKAKRKKVAKKSRTGDNRTKPIKFEHRKPEPEYRAQLNRILDDLFEYAASIGWDWRDIADNCNLCYTTVLKLGKRETNFPELRSAIEIARALEKPVSLFEDLTKRRRTRRAA